MARSRYCKVCTEWHDLEAAWPEACAGHWGTRSAGSGDARFYVISDTMGPTLNHADGRMYDSKSRYTHAVKAAGCEIVGNDKLPERRPTEMPSAARDIKRAIEELRSR